MPEHHRIDARRTIAGETETPLEVPWNQQLPAGMMSDCRAERQTFFSVPEEAESESISVPNPVIRGIRFVVDFVLHRGEDERCDEGRTRLSALALFPRVRSSP